jgi:hypothetical protein
MIRVSSFSLPSNPSHIVKIREATVADCISLADVNDAREEAATTVFLDAVCGEDSRLWTADDRRFALLWYYIHTEQDHFYKIEYECDCGETHKFKLDLKDVLDAYRPIDGPAERKIVVRGDEYVVVPLSGAAMESLELERIGIDAISCEKGDGPEVAKARLQMHLNELIYKISGNTHMESRIVEMSVGYARELITAVDDAISEMAHGIDTVYENGRIYILSPPHKCEKEVVTRCRVRFRCLDFIPEL